MSASNRITGESLSVGKQCSLKTCRKLDFLPSECAQCHEIFCGLHITSHSCGSLAHLKTHVCPNCFFSIDVMRDSAADVAMRAHLCQKKTSANKCTFHITPTKTCSRTEMIRNTCSLCSNTFCFQHGLPETHDCEVLKAQKAAIAEAAKLKGKIVSKKAVGPLPLDQVWVTQDSISISNILQLPALADYVREGGQFTSAWAKTETNRSVMSQTFDAEVTVGAQFPIHIWLIKDKHYIFRGHTFALAIQLGGRDHLLPTEYIIRKVSIDMNKPNFTVGYLCPFDPLTHLRNNQYPFVRDAIREILRVPGAEGTVPSYIEDQHGRYQSPRDELKTVADLLGKVQFQFEALPEDLSDSFIA